MCPNQTTIKQGETLILAFRWEELPFNYLAISAISLSQGAPRVSFATAHGIPDGWRVAFARVGGMTGLNALHSPPKDSDFTPARTIDANTIELNEVIPIDLQPYTTGGFAIWYTPVDIAGAVLRASITNATTGAVIASTHAGTIESTVDADNKLLGIAVPATVTAGLSATSVRVAVEVQLANDEVHKLYDAVHSVVSDSVTEVN